jgi:hypothetical protein
MIEKGKEQVTPETASSEKRPWHRPKLIKNLVSDTQSGEGPASDGGGRTTGS